MSYAQNNWNKTINDANSKIYIQIGNKNII